MVCRNICDRLGCKPSFEYDQYIVGKNTVEDVRFTFIIVVYSVHAAECS